MFAQGGGQVRIELRTGAPLRQLDGGGDTTDPVCHFGEFADRREPRGDGDGFAAEVPRPALAVPLLVGGAHRLLHDFGQAELLGEPASQGRMMLDHLVEVVTARHGEFHPDTEAVQRRVAAPERRIVASARACCRVRARTCRP